MGVPRHQWPETIVRATLALRGWAGMIRHLEERPDRAPVEPVPARLVDFVALRLVFDRVAAEWAAARLGHAGDLPGLWTELRDRFPPRHGPGRVARAYL
ncbi:MAG: putative inorganic carbon transporter subunit DabA, partial [bacterium]